MFEVVLYCCQKRQVKLTAGIFLITKLDLEITLILMYFTQTNVKKQQAFNYDLTVLDKTVRRLSARLHNRKVIQASDPK